MSTPPPEQFFNNDWPGEDPQGEDNFDQYFDVNFDQFPNDAGYFNSDFDRYLIPDTGTVQDWENDMQPHATLPQTTAEDVAVSHGSKGKKKEVSAGTREKIRQAKTGEKNPRYGKELSAETREKIRQALAGKKHPRYGKELSEETKEKIRQAKTGKKRSEETKEKLRQANIGRKHSKETKEKIRQATTGEKNPQYGKKHSAETTEKMRQAHARRRARGVGGGDSVVGGAADPWAGQVAAPASYGAGSTPAGHYGYDLGQGVPPVEPATAFPASHYLPPTGRSSQPPYGSGWQAQSSAVQEQNSANMYGHYPAQGSSSQLAALSRGMGDMSITSSADMVDMHSYPASSTAWDNYAIPESSWANGLSDGGGYSVNPVAAGSYLPPGYGHSYAGPSSRAESPSYDQRSPQPAEKPIMRRK
ncbi:NUMOD3 domain-containing DNA-binding protein [Streptomyces sp. NBC_01462]|uniref:NUMOD3 domain-containing DNA-binding protein n=1 Tax=Streptomyces sp. NBC_01462 TaxID=2903876 RepID=UPI002E32D3EE|nr:NUMOD3 domain-containing DNA-binding protein [Streptomyces sp. NBC_01462]